MYSILTVVLIKCDFHMVRNDKITLSSYFFVKKKQQSDSLNIFYRDSF